MKKSYIAAIIIVVVVIIAAIGAYALLSGDDKSEPEYYFYLEVEGEEIDELPDNWIKATGDNAMVALQGYFEEKDWSFESNGGFLSTLFEYTMVESAPDEWTYWVLYEWNDAEGAFVFSSNMLSDLVSDGNPVYIALVYKVSSMTDDGPPTITPEDVPEGL